LAPRLRHLRAVEEDPERVAAAVVGGAEDPQDVEVGVRANGGSDAGR